MKSVLMFGCVAILLAASIGCGNSGTVSVNGEVTLDGKPVTEGNIQFTAVDGYGRSAAAQIIDGRYSIDAPPGKKRVEIFAMRTIEGKFDTTSNPGEKTPLREPYIPAKYNTKSELTFEVTDGSAEKDFQLTSK